MIQRGALLSSYWLFRGVSWYSDSFIGAAVNSGENVACLCKFICMVLIAFGAAHPNNITKRGIYGTWQICGIIYLQECADGDCMHIPVIEFNT